MPGRVKLVPQDSTEWDRTDTGHSTAQDSTEWDRTDTGHGTDIIIYSLHVQYWYWL